MGQGHAEVMLKAFKAFTERGKRPHTGEKEDCKEGCQSLWNILQTYPKHEFNTLIWTHHPLLDMCLEVYYDIIGKVNIHSAKEFSISSMLKFVQKTEEHIFYVTGVWKRKLGNSSHDKSSQNTNLTSHQHRYVYFLLFPGKLFLRVDLKSVIYNQIITVRLRH